MWQAIEDRIVQNEQDPEEEDRGRSLRRALLDVFRSSGLHPGEGATKKMVSFEFGQGERLLWEIESPARNIFLDQRWIPQLEAAGFTYDWRPYKQGQKDGGRHSACGLACKIDPRIGVIGVQK